MNETNPFAKGTAFVEGDFVPIDQAKISLFDWGFTRSDVTYDVVHVWRDAFFRLDDHLDRFAQSMAGLHMKIPYDRAQITEVLGECVRRSAFSESYVAMLTTRGLLAPGMPRSRPSLMENRFFAYALPWVDVIAPEVQERGAHLIIAKTPRIPAESIDPTIKNFHWGDLVRALFEAEEAGADNAILLDHDGYVTEGPGFNIFAVHDGMVTTPDRGALEGITRKTVIEICQELGHPVRVGRLTADELRAADEIFAATTAGGVMPASRIDGTIMANDRPGPISLEIKKTYWDWHEQERFLTPVDARQAA